MLTSELKRILETLYIRYNRPEYVHPDPLEFLYGFNDIHEREIVGLIASCLAYGRVSQILRSVSSVLDIVGKSPRTFIMDGSPAVFEKVFDRFCHRFATGTNMAALFSATGKIIREYGSLNECFAAGIGKNDSNVMPAMRFFVHRLCSAAGGMGHLVPDPQKGSACKRLNLFLRWMVRKDRVDPGGWEGVGSPRLVVPVDTHMHAIGVKLGFTSRRQADIKTALEITEGFRKFSPEDPVKYDFALTRFGIRSEMNMKDLFKT
ncbi:MAG: TIGR02757 family protein [Desulfococcus sp. 4484_241]|nr:MAG: TIGR02757 family protein [Desulfococcus sp. 4484_241]